MSNNKKQKGNWLSLLVGVVLGSFIVVALIILTWTNGTGFFEGTTKEESIERKTKGDPIEKFTETVKYQSGKTLWYFLELAGTLAVPILIAFFGHQFQKREQKRAEDNLAEEAIEKYLDRMDKLLLDEKLRKELFPGKKLKLIEDKELRKEISTY